jgi:ComF family protein
MASFAYFVKEGKMQKIIHEIKYNNNPSLAFYMGQLCGKDILESSLFLDIDIIVPIPLHKKRLRERGYNQSLKIAEGVASKINKPIDAQNLIRKINNPSQTKNSRFERWKNTEGIFEIEDSSFFEEKHVLLIDDVITTGSTLEACAKQILTCKNSTISIFTVSLSI